MDAVVKKIRAARPQLGAGPDVNRPERSEAEEAVRTLIAWAGDNPNGGYDDIVMLRDIDLYSHCEHHMVPFIGKAHVAYFPDNKVVGISKLARVVDIYARRLQTQETMTAQIAYTIDNVLKPLGVAVMIEAVHQCMSIRGVQKPNVATITTQFTGLFKDDQAQQDRFLMLTRGTD